MRKLNLNVFMFFAWIAFVCVTGFIMQCTEERRMKNVPESPKYSRSDSVILALQHELYIKDSIISEMHKTILMITYQHEDDHALMEEEGY